MSDNHEGFIKPTLSPEDYYQMAVKKKIAERWKAKKKREQKYLQEKYVEHRTEKIFTDAERNHLRKRWDEIKQQDSETKKQLNEFTKEIEPLFEGGGWING